MIRMEVILYLVRNVDVNVQKYSLTIWYFITHFRMLLTFLTAEKNKRPLIEIEFLQVLQHFYVRQWFLLLYSSIALDEPRVLRHPEARLDLPRCLYLNLLILIAFLVFRSLYKWNLSKLKCFLHNLLAFMASLKFFRLLFQKLSKFLYLWRYSSVLVVFISKTTIF